MYSVKYLSPIEWSKWSEMAHDEAFGEHRPSDFNRVDFALVSVKDESPTGYIQCIETDKETVYWQTGGAFSDFRKTLFVVPSYVAMIDWCMEKYKKITTRISNTNINMLHMAMKVGFVVVGMRTVKDKILLELEFCKEGSCL